MIPRRPLVLFQSSHSNMYIWVCLCGRVRCVPGAVPLLHGDRWDAALLYGVSSGSVQPWRSSRSLEDLSSLQRYVTFRKCPLVCDLLWSSGQCKGLSMRESEANRPRMWLSHRARNECLSSANSRLHARWRRPTMLFFHVAYVYLVWFT